MHEFVQLFKIYESINRFALVKQVYGKSKKANKFLLWISTISTPLAIALIIFFKTWWISYLIILMQVVFWSYAFSRAEKSVFLSWFKHNDNLIVFFGKDSQYLRYLSFVEKSDTLLSKQNIKTSIAAISSILDTEENSIISTHPFVAFFIGAFLAVLGGSVGQWSPKTTVIVLTGILLVFYVSYLVLGSIKPRHVKLKEFKRFLHWADANPSLT